MDAITLKDITQILKEVNVISTTFRVILAMLIGGILGFERETRNRPAGFRTYMLVCISSTMVMVTNQYIYQNFETVNSDPARLGAQVISGIGFLGAGSIIVTKRNQIKGLTTAAGLWSAACLGLTIGIGFYSGAIIGGLGIFTAIMFLHKVDKKIKMGSKLIDIYVEFNNITRISSFLNYVQENNLEVQDLLINKGQIPGNENIALIVTLKSKTKTSHPATLQLLSQVEGVQYIEEI